MRFKMRFVPVVLAVAVMAGLTGIWAVPALSQEAGQSKSAVSSQTERDIQLMDWFAHQYEQGLPVTDADKKVYLELQSRYGASRQETTDNSHRGRQTLDEYIWTTAPYDWVDISTIGTNTGLTGDDQNLGPFTLGFSFPFYGNTYTSIRVCSNGWLSPTSTSTIYSETAIPTTAEPNNALYVFWDDMYLPDGGQILYYADAANQRFIVSWLAVQHISGTEPYTYQAILYPNGNIVYQYQTIPTSTPSNTNCTVGAENATGTEAVQVCFDGTGTPPTSGTALLVGQPDGVPNPVTDLAVQYIAPNAIVTWTDPTEDTNGNQVTLTNVEVWLGPVGTGTLLATVSPGMGSYVHFNAPTGHLTYTVRPFNDPYYGGAASVPLTVGTPGYASNFDSNNGQWVATPATGGWEWGIPWGIAGLTPHSLPDVWGTVVAANYTDNACWQLDLNLGLVVTSDAATVEFYHWFYSQASYDGCNFKVSVDNGATWTVLTPTAGGYSTTALLATTCMTGQPAWAGTTPWTWQRCVIPIGQFVGQVPIFRFEFSSNTSTNYSGFYFDDFEIWGVSGQQSGIPTACTNLVGSYVEPNSVLTWTDPTLDSQGNPLLIDSVQIWLGAAGSGTRLGSVGPGVQTFTHINPPISFQTYSVRPCHGTFFGPPVSVTIMVGNPSYVNNFELDNGGWVPDPPTGGWEWGVPTYASGPTAHSGTKLWGTVLAGTYANSVCQTLTLTPNMAVTSPDAFIEFWRWWYTEQSFDGVNFKVSLDNGATWTLVDPEGGYPYTASTANVCIPSEPYWAGSTGGVWTRIVIPIGQFAGQIPLFRFTFGSDGSVVYPGFYFDDLIIWGMGNVPGIPRPPTGLAASYAAGNVTLTWTDPSQDVGGSPLTPDSIQVWLGQVGTGTRLGSASPGVQSYVHLNAPVGIQTYGIRAYNDGYLSAPVSASVTVGNPSFANDFNVNDGGWVPDPTAGGWSWGAPTNTSAPAPHSPPYYWGTGLTANYTDGVGYKLDYGPGLVVQDAAGYVEFWFRYNSELSYDGCNFKASVDNGSTWTVLTPSEGPYTSASLNTANVFMGGQPAWSGTGTTAWQHATIPIGSLVGQTPIFRLEFSSDPIVSGYAGFFFDDMLIWGLASPAGIPRAVTNLAGNYVAPNVVLTWTDPSLDMTGLPLTPDSIQIWLGTIANGQRIGAVAGGLQTFTHLNAPSGHATYTVRAFAGGHGSTPASVSVTVGNPSYDNNFNTDDGGWVPDGGWSWGVPTNGSAPAPYSPPSYWGTGLLANYGDGVDYKLDLNTEMEVQSPSAEVEFWFRYGSEGTYDGCNFKVSVDGGATWAVLTPSVGPYTVPAISTLNTFMAGQPAWSGTQAAWQHAVIPIGSLVGQTPIFRFEFSSDPSVSSMMGFFFDDMTIWGLRPPSSITGTVRAFLTSQPIAGARVWATDWPDTAVTDSVGFYELGIDPGTYSVTVDHMHYCDTTFANVLVVQGGQTIRDAVLRRPLAQITRTSIAFLTFPGVDVSDTFRISNSGGQCPLDFAIADTSEWWLTVDPASGTVNPNQSVTITVSANAPEIVGDYSSSLVVTYNAVGTPSVIRVDLSTVDAAGELGVIPTEFAYYPNYPNPFNAQTSLHFDVPKQSRVQITIYNIIGQQVARPVDRPFAPGRYRVLFDAGRLPSGMYLVKMSAADYTKIGKMMLLK